jgi:hypothetical protein
MRKLVLLSALLLTAALAIAATPVSGEPGGFPAPVARCS